jgi:hypothetical protein
LSTLPTHGARGAVVGIKADSQNLFEVAIERIQRGLDSAVILGYTPVQNQNDHSLIRAAPE